MKKRWKLKGQFCQKENIAIFLSCFNLQIYLWIQTQKKKKNTYNKALKLELEKETRQNKGVIELFIYFNHFPWNGRINIPSRLDTFNRNKTAGLWYRSPHFW